MKHSELAGVLIIESCLNSFCENKIDFVLDCLI